MYFNQKAIINNVQSHYQTNGMEWTLLLHLMMVSWFRGGSKKPTPSLPIKKFFVTANNFC